MSRFLVRLACLVLLTVSAMADTRPLRLDPSRPLHEYVVSAWRDTNGLPVDSVGAVAQTPDGYLWLSTEHGVVRFDGTRFTVFTKENTPALRTNDIFTLFVSRDGTLWIGTRGGGAVRYSGGQFVRVPIRLRYIFGIAESDDGAIWIGAPGGLVRLHHGREQLFTKKEGYAGGRLMAMAGGTTGVYLAFPSGVTHLDARGTRSWNAQHGLAHPVTALRMTSRGLLAGNDAGGVDRLEGDRFAPLIRPTAQAGAITSILEGAHESVWMSTAGGGIVRFANGTTARLTANDGLSSDTINELIEDFEGNLWGASTGGGLVRIREAKITSVDTRQPVIGDWVLPLLQARDRSIWFATNGGGLNHLTDGGLTRLTTADGLKANIIGALAEGHDGSIWVGTEEGLQRVAGGKVVETIAAGGLANAQIFAITVARDGTIWVGTDQGLVHIAHGAVTPITEKEGIKKGHVTSIREAEDGTLWLARLRAIEHYAPGKGKLACFTRGEGLHATTIYGITIDEVDGSIWIATSEDGLGRIRGGRLRMYRAADGLLTNSAYTVVQDATGNLWIPTSLGLYTIKRENLDRFDAGQATELHIDSFRKADGLKSSDFSGGFDRPGFRALDGTLWFPTTRGMVVVDPSKLRVNRNPPRVLIESVTTHDRQIEIAYTSPSFASPESTTFRYKLEGFDDEWRDVGTRRTAYFTHVPPGSYRFRVEATTAEGITREASTAFEIEPRIHETLLFKAAIALTVLLIILVIFRRRLEALHERQAAVRESEEHFRSLIEHASDMILVVAGDGRIRYASPSVTRALGLSASYLDDLVADRDAAAGFLAAAYQSGPHSAVLPFRDADGARRDVESIGARLRDTSDIILNCRDITDRCKLETQLAQANRLASLGRLAATVSHEFNNVLMGIQPYVDILRRTTQDRTHERALTQIGQSVRRGKRISEEILSFTRPVEPSRRAVRVREWLLDLEIELRALVGSHVRVAIMATDDLTLDGDAGQLSQVLTNLAINARDAGATAIRIEASFAEGNGVYPFGIVREPHRSIHLQFADNGGGIPEHVLPCIFEPLFTTKRSKGTGLGLAVAQKIIAAHAGELFVESTTGLGTTFHVFLPIAIQDSTEEDANNVVSIATASCRVLLVEDDSAVADGMLTLLEAEGFHAALATNGGDALNLIPRFEPDVIVLDIGLPDMDGFEVYERVMKRWPAMQVVFSTGHDLLAPEDRKCLLKPYTIDELLEAIASCAPNVVLAAANVRRL
jgi:PAS domain S-box-containing protein